MSGYITFSCLLFLCQCKYKIINKSVYRRTYAVKLGQQSVTCSETSESMMDVYVTGTKYLAPLCANAG